MTSFSRVRVSRKKRAPRRRIERPHREDTVSTPPSVLKHVLDVHTLLLLFYFFH